MKKNICIALIFLFLTSVSLAQTWSAVGNGVNGRVASFAIYNGELYIGGGLATSSGINSPLMKWNGTSFDTLPGSYLVGPGRIEAMAVFNNQLYAGGAFNNPKFKYILRWNGTAFDTVGGGLDNVVYSMAVYNGNLYVGGDMEFADGITANGIAKWDGSQWMSVANGISPNARVFELEVYKNELYASGNFVFPSLNNTYCIARWNDTLWKEVGVGGIIGVVYALGTFNNELYAGGPYFTVAGGEPVNDIAKWNGSTWTAVGSGIGSNVAHIFAIKEYHNELYVGGTFKIMNGDSMRSIARYDGSVWDSVGTGIDSTNIVIDTLYNYPGPWDTTYVNPAHEIYAFIEFNNDLYVGGIFSMIGGVPANNIAKWSTPVGIDQLSKSNSIFVFPNPLISSSTLQLTTQLKDAEVVIYDMLGKEMLRKKLTGDRMEIERGSLVSGVYFVRVRDGERQWVEKVVVQ